MGRVARGRAYVAALAALLLTPSYAGSAPATTEVVGLWDPTFSAGMSAADCERWTLDARGFCTADDVRNGVELGMKFQSSRDLAITGIRIYRVDLHPVTGSLWSADGTRLATAEFAPTTTTGWQDLTFTEPVDIAAGRTYLASYNSPATQYAFSYDFFDEQLTRGPITALRAVDGDPNGVHCYDTATCTFPTRAFRSSAYWVTPLWENPVGAPVPPQAAPAPPSDVKPPSVREASPSSGATRVALGTRIRVRFSEHVRASLLTRDNVRLLRGRGTRVPAILTYDEQRRRLVVKPTMRLRPMTTYRVVIASRVVDIAGNRLDQDPHTPGVQQAAWRFRTR